MHPRRELQARPCDSRCSLVTWTQKHCSLAKNSSPTTMPRRLEQLIWSSVLLLLLVFTMCRFFFFVWFFTLSQKKTPHNLVRVLKTEWNTVHWNLRFCAFLWGRAGAFPDTGSRLKFCHQRDHTVAWWAIDTLNWEQSINLLFHLSLCCQIHYIAIMTKHTDEQDFFFQCTDLGVELNNDGTFSGQPRICMQTTVNHISLFLLF